MSVLLKAIAAFLLIVGFWVLLSAFDKTGRERVFRIRVGVGSMVAGAGNLLIFIAPAAGWLLVVIGALFAVTTKRY